MHMYVCKIIDADAFQDERCCISNQSLILVRCYRLGHSDLFPQKCL